MALAATTTLTIKDEMDSDGGVGVLDNDFFLSGTGSIGIDVDIETWVLENVSVVPGTATDMSAGTHIYAAMLCMTQPTLDLQVNGGMGIGVMDSLDNWKVWFVGGVDTYNGGWDIRTAYTGNVHDAASATLPIMTDITAIVTYWKCLAKSKLALNCYMDRTAYGNGAALIVTGTNTVANIGWSELLNIADAADATRGYLKSQIGSYIGKGPITIGDNVGTLTTNFSDDFNEIVFPEQPVSSIHYAINGVGNAIGTTDITLSAQVLKSAGEPFGIDFTDVNITSLSLTASTIAVAGLSYFISGQTITNNVFSTCDQIDPGASTFNTNKISKTTSTIGALLFPTSLSTNFTSNDFLDNTIGSAIQIAVGPGPYDYNGHTFSGNTFDTNNTSGASLTVNKLNDSNPTTYTGSVVTYSASFTLTLTDIPENVQTTIVNSSTRTELQNSLAPVSGIITYGHSGGETVDIMFMHLSYDPNLSDIYSLTLPNSNSSIKISMIDDTNYDNPV